MSGLASDFLASAVVEGKRKKQRGQRATAGQDGATGNNEELLSRCVKSEDSFCYKAFKKKLLLRVCRAGLIFSFCFSHFNTASMLSHTLGKHWRKVTGMQHRLTGRAAGTKVECSKTNEQLGFMIIFQ